NKVFEIMIGIEEKYKIKYQIGLNYNAFKVCLATKTSSPFNASIAIFFLIFNRLLIMIKRLSGNFDLIISISLNPNLSVPAKAYAKALFHGLLYLLSYILLHIFLQIVLYQHKIFAL
ncbi:hypothetical protein, partial [Acinetobacter nosocomialis]